MVSIVNVTLRHRLLVTVRHENNTTPIGLLLLLVVVVVLYFCVIVSLKLLTYVVILEVNI